MTSERFEFAMGFFFFHSNDKRREDEEIHGIFEGNSGGNPSVPTGVERCSMLGETDTQDVWWDGVAVVTRDSFLINLLFTF